MEAGLLHAPWASYRVGTGESFEVLTSSHALCVPDPARQETVYLSSPCAGLKRGHGLHPPESWEMGSREVRRGGWKGDCITSKVKA